MARDSVSQAVPALNHHLSIISMPPFIMIGQIETPLASGLPPWLQPPSAMAPAAAEDIPVENLEIILSKTPARKVAQVRLACKYWKEITSSPHFINMHTDHWSKNLLSQILIEKKVDDNRTASLYSIQSEILGSSSASSPLAAAGVLGSYGPKTVSFSGLGFLVLQDEKLKSPSCEIINPVTRENVKLMVKDEDDYLRGKVFAIYLHPKLKEICVLWGQRDRLSRKTTEFKLLNLKSAIKKPGDSCWRKIVPRLHNYIPRHRANRVVPPVILNNVLYWMIDVRKGEISCEDAILAFDTEREEFQKLSHPGPYCAGVDEDDVWNVHENMFLLQTNGEHLSLCEFSDTDESINTWERRSGKWMRKYRVKSNAKDLIRFWSGFCSDSYKVLGMVNRESVFLANTGTGELYLVNLKHGSLEVLEGEEGLCKHSFVCAHSPTFATITSGGSHGEVLVQVPTGVRAIKHLKYVIY